MNNLYFMECLMRRPSRREQSLSLSSHYVEYTYFPQVQGLGSLNTPTTTIAPGGIGHGLKDTHHWQVNHRELKTCPVVLALRGLEASYQGLDAQSRKRFAGPCARSCFKLCSYFLSIINIVFYQFHVYSNDSTIPCITWCS